MELEIFFYGKKCHSFTPEKGKSAIYECIDFINEIKTYYAKNIKKKLNSVFQIPYTTMNIGIIEGGETVNSVPGKCRITIDFRIANVGQAQKIIEEIKNKLKKYETKLYIKNNVEPKINENELSFLEKITTKKETKCYITEGSFIDKDFIILGPGPDTSHQKNEYILASSLKKTEEIYIKIIKYYNERNN